jgi:NADH-quinone oxidoreductase subunit J
MRFGAVLAAVLAAELVWALATASRTRTFGAEAVSSVREIGLVLFTDYAFAFEVTSVLILVAMLGAVLMARRERTGQRPGERRE